MAHIMQNRTIFARLSHTWRCNVRSVSQRRISSVSPFLKVSEEVQTALATNQPVVALETTVYTHGFPHPENIALAAQLEAVVRANGAVPATIGILNGVARVGMTQNELHSLLQEGGARKISRRDIAFALGAKCNGGTTIAGTLVLAHLAGIRVFATGGLGGVHRGGQDSLDISADLTELGRTPLAVISSGCKSFLDIGRTLEYLETQGVGVATFADGRPGKVGFPAFWSRDSGVESPYSLQSEMEAAMVIHAQTVLGLSSGFVFGNPVPAAASIPFGEMQAFIDQAVSMAEEAGITGHANTPFVLKTIKELSSGKSVVANRVLLEANAERGAKVAVSLASLQDSQSSPLKDYTSISYKKNTSSVDVAERASQVSSNEFKVHIRHQVDVLVAGALAIDCSCDYTPLTSSGSKSTPSLHTSNPAVITQSLGGVGHNIARAVQLMGTSVRLCSVISDDISGDRALKLLTAEGLDTSAIDVRSCSNGDQTAQYISFNDRQKNLVMAMADMNIMEDESQFSKTFALAKIKASQPKWIVLDANWNSSSFESWMDTAKAEGVSIAYEPVSIEKSTRLFKRKKNPLPIFPAHALDLATPNALELNAMFEAARSVQQLERQDWWKVIDAMGISAAGARTELVKLTSADLVDQGVPQQSIQLLPFIPTILTKLGSRGVLLTKLLSSQDSLLNSPAASRYILSRSRSNSVIGGIFMRLFSPPQIVTDIESVNGAGDTFMGAIVAGLATSNMDRLEAIIDVAQEASIMTLHSKDAVSPRLGDLRRSLTLATGKM